MTEIIEPTERTKIMRVPTNGNFERASVYKILDEGFICHVGFIAENQLFVIPTNYARDGERLLIHGSAASRMMRLLCKEIEVCVTVTLIDGLVLARSAYHHSMNYRSVVIFGQAQLIECVTEKLKALELFSEHLIPSRWADVRPPNEKELKATTVLSLQLNEASAKIRTGAPVDEAEDYALEVWTGVLPMELTAGKPISDPQMKAEISIPTYVSDYRR